VVLSWPAPNLGRREANKSYISRVDVYRVRELRSQEPILDEDDFATFSQYVGYLDRATIETQQKTLGHIEYHDPLNISGAAGLSNIRLRYAIRYVNNRDQFARFSNTVAIEPVAAISTPPTDLTAAAPSQDLIALSWTAPTSDVNGARPASVIGYNVYRRRADAAAGGDLLNSTPLPETKFEDRKFAYKEPYLYFVRAVSQGANGLIESADSEVKDFTAIDTFPPATPDPVSIASANGVISIFWPASPESDVVGYNVYRADSPDAKDSEWVKLTPQPSEPTTFRDDQVVIDRTYYYRVTSIDRFNNESPRSRPVGETVHP